MKRQRWHQVKAVFDEALALESGERIAFLDRKCGDDQELRTAVEVLLAEHDPEENTDPVSSVDTTVDEPSEVDQYLNRIGPYKLLEKIGQGGFGEVFLAKQLAPVRRERVALKMIKPGMDTRRVLARFEAERQALALMNHPCIASVLGAGMTPGGRPYFVMEYVPGLPITEHCDRERLTIEERLELFCQVGDAIQHAHQKGVIHRDIKPSNVLVSFADGKAVPKVIDFGVAKALDRPLTDQTLHTLRGELVGTPAYMSPELADPTIQDIDTRSDVYAMGVLLYELLTGVLPFAPEDLLRAGYDEMRRIIREQDPPKPSHLISTLTTADGQQSSDLAARRKLRDPRTLERLMRDDLDWIALKCLEKDRGRRYGGVSLLVDDVRHHLNHEPVTAGPPQVGYRVKKFLRRHRGAVASLSLTVLVLLAGVVVSTVLAVDRANERRIRVAQQVVLDQHRAVEVLEEARALAYGFEALARDRASDALALDPALDAARILRVATYVASPQPDRDAAIAEARRAYEAHADSPPSPALAALLSALLQEREPQESRRLGGGAAAGLEENRMLYYRALGTTDDRFALELLDASLALNPWQQDVTEQLIQRLFLSGQFERALEEARLLTKVASDRPVAWSLEGEALSLLGRYDEGRASYEHAIELAPNLWIGYIRRAWISHRQGQYEEALTDLATALELNPGSRDVLAMMAAAHIRLQQWEPALKALDAVIAAAPGFMSLRDRAFVNQQLGNLEAALADFEAVVRYTDQPAERIAKAHDRRGSVLRMLARPDEARSAFQTAIELQPELARAHHNLGYLEFTLGNDAAALPHIERAIELEPGQWESNRGIVNWFLGRRDAAVRDLQPYARQKGYETVYAWLWELEQEAGNPVLAKAALDDALAATQREFVRIMVGVLRGERTPDELVQAAENPGDELVALLTAAGKARLDDRPDEAREWLTRAAAVNLRNWQEYDIAARRLHDLQ